VHDGILLNENFTETVKNNLNSGAENVNFGAPGAVDTVNQWVSKMTGGKIEKLVDSFSSSTALFLANALYFKEEWLVPFDDTDYQGEPVLDEFITKDGKVTANFIQQYNNNATYGEIEIQGDHVVPVVTLPYKNDLFEMQIIAPKSIQDLKWLEEKMKLSNEQDLTDSSDSYFNLFSTPNDLEDLQYNEFNDGEDVEIYLKMPTFQARSDVDVVEPLQKLGAKKVFGPGAELEELASGPLSVSKIKHIALVEVTKEGTEGAAATGAEIVLLSASFRDRKDINVVSPFIFIVQDKQNNIPILVGKIMDPTIKIP
jgi:serpin B